MKLIYLLLFCFLVQMNVNAEKHLISLKDLKMKPVYQGFYIDEIIDAREEKFCLGFVKKGMANKRIPAFFERGINEELNGFFEKYFLKNKSTERLSIRINHLFIYEITYENSEFSSVELNVSFLKKEKDGYVELLQVGHSLERTGLDVTKFHPEKISNAFQYCFEIYQHGSGLRTDR